MALAVLFDVLIGCQSPILITVNHRDLAALVLHFLEIMYVQGVNLFPLAFSVLVCWTSVVRDGRLISRDLKGQSPKRPFQYFDKGSMAVVGKNFAILESGRLHMSGFLTWLVWVFLHLMSLPQLQDRLRVQIEWFWAYHRPIGEGRLCVQQQGAST